jgi:hypothetical protein
MSSDPIGARGRPAAGTRIISREGLLDGDLGDLSRFELRALWPGIGKRPRIPLGVDGGEEGCPCDKVVQILMVLGCFFSD